MTIPESLGDLAKAVITEVDVDTKKTMVDWAKNTIECRFCEAEEKITFPISVDDLVKKLNDFQKQHTHECGGESEEDSNGTEK